MVSNPVNPFGGPHGGEIGISKFYQRDADRETGLDVVWLAEGTGPTSNPLYPKDLFLFSFVFPSSIEDVSIWSGPKSFRQQGTTIADFIDAERRDTRPPAGSPGCRDRC